MTLASKRSQATGVGPAVDRHSDESAANTAISVSTPTGLPRKLLFATAKYSAAPTQAGVTTEVDSGAGATYDAVLNTGTANAQTTVYIPGGDVTIASDDAIKVTAPAGGAGITAAVAVYTQPD